MNWKESGRKRPWPDFRYFGICVYGMKNLKASSKGKQTNPARYETWTPESEAVMEVERETPFEESAGGRLLACLHFPLCVELDVTCSTPTDTRTLSFCGSLVERLLLATLTTVNCTVRQRSGTCDENSCAGQLCTGFPVSVALIRPHVHTVQMSLL